MRADAARPTGPVTGVDVENIVLLVITAALVVYLLVALLDPERF